MHADIEARVREGLEAFNEGDLDRFVATMAEDARYRVAREHPESRLCEGRDQIRDYHRSWIDGVENPRVERARRTLRDPAWP